MHDRLNYSPLGKTTEYETQYNPNLLFVIPRAEMRQSIGIANALPFHGIDIWDAYEISWLNSKGKPLAAIGEFLFPCTSAALVESKSLKLYLNSFNQTHFSSIEEVHATLVKDLSQITESTVGVKLQFEKELSAVTLENFKGFCLDDLDVEVSIYKPHPQFLKSSGSVVHETLYSHLLKSNCPVTGQPDWANISIEYMGPQIDREGILKYLISYRENEEFHEQCIERIYMDIGKQCRPSQLTVYGRYTRRGGLDINVFRSNFAKNPVNKRNIRQ